MLSSAALLLPTVFRSVQPSLVTQAHSQAPIVVRETVS